MVASSDWRASFVGNRCAEEAKSQAAAVLPKKLFATAVLNEKPIKRGDEWINSF
jgi:hypothetical protein